MSDWFAVRNVDEVESPALLFYADRIQENIRRMIDLAGGPDRLRPHIKTHKCPELVRLQLDAGISKFKCATVAEAEMACAAGARDVLLAYPVVGPNIGRWLQLTRRYPNTRLACVADDPAAIGELAGACSLAGQTAEVLLDIDCGQGRTGVPPCETARKLYRMLSVSPGLVAGGLHVYDGHIHESDPVERRARCVADFGPVHCLISDLRAAGLIVPRIVAGGTPTFPIHAEERKFECSPGTCVLWDFGYSTHFSDLGFQHGALVLSRVVSRPAGNRLCLDLGHKAIASENPPPRVHFLNLPEASAIQHNEEHLVIETGRASEFKIGDALFGVPRHICPTVALYSEAVVVKEEMASVRWPITARARRLTI
jgi:D-serine deaminase-like pyridoxal phosphate-dependent protein